MGKRKKKRLFFTIGAILAIPVFIAAGLFIYTFYLPETISIKTGQESTVEYFLPFKAEIIPESISTISINDRKISDNIRVDLKGKAKILADHTGIWNMRLYLYGMPMKTVRLEAIEDRKLVAGGDIVGIRINTNGILVLGTGDVKTEGSRYIDPSKDKVKTGDLIQQVNGVKIYTKEELISSVESAENQVSLTISRGGNIITRHVSPVVSMDDGKKKLGLWVRDSTQGIGTLTYWDSKTGSFGALGHPITDVDTGELMELRDGNIYKANIVSVQKGEKGVPGQITGEIEKDGILGDIKDNNSCGIYGEANKAVSGKEYEIALKNQIHPGKASIISCIEGTSKMYDIEIVSINSLNKNDSKGMVIKITDKELLEKTGGIIQGMSGSPIIQNNKLVGAVTHVFVRDPTRGYGIFIENML